MLPRCKNETHGYECKLRCSDVCYIVILGIATHTTTALCPTRIALGHEPINVKVLAYNTVLNNEHTLPRVRKIRAISYKVKIIS